MKLITTSAVVGCVLAMAVQQAGAISYTLGFGNSGVSSYPGPYGTVDVTLNTSTQATVTFTGDTVGGYTYIFGGTGCVAVNVNATSWSVSGFAGTAYNGDSAVVGNLSSGGAGNENGFGSFNQTINNFDGFQHSWSTVTFLLTDTSGTWASAASVLTGNSENNIVAAHIFVVDDSTGANPSTGFATQTGGTEIPDGGATVLLLGTALTGLGMIKRLIVK